ncbi:MAG: hypothetical protein ACI9VT_001120, partial [Psychroserpens sp.]
YLIVLVSYESLDFGKWLLNTLLFVISVKLCINKLNFNKLNFFSIIKIAARLGIYYG